MLQAIHFSTGEVLALLCVGICVFGKDAMVRIGVAAQTIAGNLEWYSLRAGQRAQTNNTERKHISKAQNCQKQ